MINEDVINRKIKNSRDKVGMFTLSLFMCAKKWNKKEEKDINIYEGSFSNQRMVVARINEKG